MARTYIRTALIMVDEEPSGHVSLTLNNAPEKVLRRLAFEQGRRFESVVFVPREAIRNLDKRLHGAVPGSSRCARFIATIFEAAELWGLDPSGLIVAGLPWSTWRRLLSPRVCQALRGRRGDRGALRKANMVCAWEIACIFKVHTLTVRRWQRTGVLPPPVLTGTRLDGPQMGGGGRLYWHRSVVEVIAQRLRERPRTRLELPTGVATPTLHDTKIIHLAP